MDEALVYSFDGIQPESCLHSVARRLAREGDNPGREPILAIFGAGGMAWARHTLKYVFRLAILGWGHGGRLCSFPVIICLPATLSVQA